MSRVKWHLPWLSPVLCFLFAIFVGPFIYMVWLSLTDLSLAAAQRNGNFIGIGNYSSALRDMAFIGTLARSAGFAFLCVFPEMLIAIALAELLHSRRIARRLLSPLLAIPVFLPSVVIGLYWRILLQGEFGVLSYWLSELGVRWAKGILSDPRTILFTLAAIDVWQWCPFVTLVLLAARGSLPLAPVEAAWVDGASRWRAFIDITLPALAPTVFVLSLIRAIDSFKEFDKVFILTGGGPGTASELSSIYTWRVAFRMWDIGYAAALCVVVYIVIYVVSWTGFSRFRLGGVR
ncbi:MAG: multiple sugar transport system permease protein [Blastocatellia bacterium]|nr:multiple sugar transport system permease protein [Blastocatellia bacterium]